MTRIRRRGKKYLGSGPPTNNLNVGKKIEKSATNRRTPKKDVASTSTVGLSSATTLNPPVTTDATTSHALTTSKSKAIESKPNEESEGRNNEDKRKDNERRERNFEGKRKGKERGERNFKGKRKDKESGERNSERTRNGKEIGERISGFIFMCSAKTKPECYQHRVFGLPKGKKEVVDKIKYGAKLFLFDFDLKLLYGIYKATSDGRLNLEPNAFKGNFPAQVRFKVHEDCLPIPESSFKHAIKENYEGRSKFRQELSSKQVRILTSLFRPITVQSHAARPPHVPNVANLPLYTTPGVQEVYQLPARPPPEESYLSAVHHAHVLPVIGSQSEHLIPHSVYDQYDLETHVGRVQHLMEPRHIIQEASLPRYTDSYYLTEANQPYMPEKVLFSAQDPYGRYGIAAESLSREQVFGRESEHHSLQISGAGEGRSENGDGYYSSHMLPSATSRIPLPPAYAQRELALSSTRYYASQDQGYMDALQRSDGRGSGSGMVEPNLPVSSRYSFVGATASRR